MSNEKDNSVRCFLNALCTYMEDWDVKQRDLAERSGLTPGRISEIINGKYTPGLKTQSRIAESFGLTLPLFLLHGNASQLGDESEKLINQLAALDIQTLIMLVSTTKNKWLLDILPGLLILDKNGQKAVKAAAEAFRAK